MKFRKRLALVVFFAASLTPWAAAQLTIVPTFDDSTLTGQTKTDFENSIDTAIQNYSSLIITPITVNITFKADESVGLGQSETFINFINYSRFRSDLVTHATTSFDSAALAHLPVQTNNPVDGNSQVYLTLANLRALGETALGNNGGGSDSTISLKTSLMNLTRSGTQDSNKYDLITTVSHEIDEVLGFGSDLNGLANGAATPTTAVSPLDLFRYTSGGVRSFNTSASTQAFFSIDTTTLLTQFNQQAPGDYQDFKTGAQPQVQDAFGSPGTAANLGINEKIALDVIGYTLTAIPEPATTALLMGTALLGLAGVRKLRTRRRAAA